jgi:uncharacterized protein YcfJ
MSEREKKMRHARTKILALAALALGLTTVAAEAANCQGRRDTGTAVGAIGGGVVGNAATRGSTGGTIAGAIIGGIAGNVIGGHDCEEQRDSRQYEQRDTRRDEPRRHYDSHGVAFYYDRDGRRHYYR